MSDQTRYKGVYRCGKKWKSQIQINGIQHYIGVFDTQEEAAAEYSSVSKQAKARKSIPFELIDDSAINSLKKIKNQEDTGIQRVETSCVVFVSHKEASNLAAKIRFGQISIAILSAQLTETNEIFHQDDLLRLQDLIDEQISSSKSFL